MRRFARSVVHQLLMACALGALCTAQTEASNDQELQAALNEAVAKKLVFLKHPCPGPFRHFNKDGQCVGSAPANSWTTDGVIEIDKVRVTSTAIELEGSQVVVTFDLWRNKLEQKFKRGRPVLVVIDRDVSAPGAIVGSVFVTSGERHSDYVPEYWKGFLKNREQAGTNEWDEKLVSSYLDSVIAFKEEVSRVGGVVMAPKPISAPDPHYDKYAKSAKFQGAGVLRVIVDTEGNTRDIQILRPLGFGLDEKSIEAVKRWRFKPATRDGVPVAVRVNVEVNFRLY